MHISQEYLDYLETAWTYLPYLTYAFYTFVILTFVPKSFGKIVSFAAADYEANRNKYHRCYGPDLCCHALSEEHLPKAKPRRAVTRVYPKRHSTAEVPLPRERESLSQIKRQVEASLIQTRTNVNQIARMFEKSAVDQRKVGRVPPTILPEIRMYLEDDDEPQEKSSQSSREYNSSSPRSQSRNENLVNRLKHSATERHNEPLGINAGDSWSSEPLVPKRRIRPMPSTLTYAGTSATPSTASPAASSSPLSSPHSSPPASPVLLRPALNMRSSVEDIFLAIADNAVQNDQNFIYAGCKTLSPVLTIDDILSERRLSRPLSAYSISDLLKEESAAASKEETYVESFLRTLSPETEER